MPRKRRRLRNRVVLLPSAFTLANIFCGFYSLIMALAGNYDAAAKAIGVAFIFDMLDGRIARMANATTEFGLQLDSLADVISFGVAPAILVMAWGFDPVGHLGWTAAFVYLICGAMRLARFNVQGSKLKHFVGMPIPAAGCLIAAIVHYFPASIETRFASSAMAFLVLALGFLMISTIRYPSLKFIALGRGRAYLKLALLGLLMAGIYFYSQPILLALSTAYASTGLFVYVSGLLRRRKPLEPRLQEEELEARS